MLDARVYLAARLMTFVQYVMSASCDQLIDTVAVPLLTSSDDSAIISIHIVIGFCSVHCAWQLNLFE